MQDFNAYEPGKWQTRNLMRSGDPDENNVNNNNNNEEEIEDKEHEYETTEHEEQKIPSTLSTYSKAVL